MRGPAHSHCTVSKWPGHRPGRAQCSGQASEALLRRTTEKTAQGGGWKLASRTWSSPPSKVAPLGWCLSCPPASESGPSAASGPPLVAPLEARPGHWPITWPVLTDWVSSVHPQLPLSGFLAGSQGSPHHCFAQTALASSGCLPRLSAKTGCV